MKKLWIALLFISSLSYAQWTDNPGENTVINSIIGSKYVPKVAVTPEGNYFFSWYGGSGNLDMNLAYFDNDGYELWPSGAMKVSTHPQNSWVDDYDLQCDNEGNAIVVFSDIRDGGKSVVVYKVDAEGNQLWGEDGVFFSILGSDEYQPKASVAPDNSVYVYFSSNYSNGANNKIFVHRIEADGTLTWGENGKIFNDEFAVNWTLPSGIANDDNSLTIGFFRETGNFPAVERWIKCFRCDTDGELMFPDTIVTNAGGISNWDDMTMVGPGDGSAYFAWNDDRYFNNTYEVYAQGVDPDGNTLWTPSGELLAVEGSGHQIYQIPAGINNSGEFVVLWNRLNPNQSAGSLVYQRVSQDGELLETNAGKTILPISTQMQNGLGAIQKGDTTFFLYTYYMDGSTFYTTYNMLALDAMGEMLWPQPVELTNSEIERTHADLSQLHDFQMVVCWSDDYNSNNRVVAQNIFTDGALGSSTVNVLDIEEPNFKHFIGINKIHKTIQMRDLEDGDEIKIFNLYGQEIFHCQAKNTLNLNRYLRGAYIAVLYRETNKLETFKFTL